MRRILLTIIIVICSFRLQVLAAQTGNHYFKAIVPFRTEDLNGKEESLYQFIGVDVWSNRGSVSKDPGLIVMIRDYGLTQPALVGAIENTSDSNIKDVVCLWRSKYDYDTFSSKYGTDIYACYYISIWSSSHGVDLSRENPVISANHNPRSNEDTLVPRNYAYYEEISEEEYNSYITKDASSLVVRSNNKDNQIQKNFINPEIIDDEDIYDYYVNNEEHETYGSRNNTNSYSGSLDKYSMVNRYKISGWYRDIDGWRYFDNYTGKALSGWNYIDGAWYYFMPGSCVMQINTIIDGYLIGIDGKWIPNEMFFK